MIPEIRRYTVVLVLSRHDDNVFEMQLDWHQALLDALVSLDFKLSVSRVILIEKSCLDQIVHVPKLFSLLHWSQNIFCFPCSSTPSHVGKFFRLQWEF